MDGIWRCVFILYIFDVVKNSNTRGIGTTVIEIHFECVLIFVESPGNVF